MERLFKQLKNFLFDCDGVLWHYNNPINGSQDVIKRLIMKNKNVFLVTNNSTKTSKDYAEKCRQLGYPVDANNIICTANLTAHILKSKKISGPVYLMGSEAMKKELDLLDISNFGFGPDETPFEDIDKINFDKPVESVVVGFDKYINYVKILKASTYINMGAKFYATNLDPNAPGLLRTTPGTGCIVQSVATASQIEPEVIGKPSRHILDYIKEKFGDFREEESIFIGDRLDTDIAFGNRFGMHTLLVLSGVTKGGNLSEAHEPENELLKPGSVLASIGDILNYI